MNNTKARNRNKKQFYTIHESHEIYLVFREIALVPRLSERQIQDGGSRDASLKTPKQMFYRDINHM